MKEKVNKDINTNDLYIGKSHPDDFCHIIDFYKSNEIPSHLKYIFVFEIPNCIYIYKLIYF